MSSVADVHAEQIPTLDAETHPPRSATEGLFCVDYAEHDVPSYAEEVTSAIPLKYQELSHAPKKELKATKSTKDAEVLRTNPGEMEFMSGGGSVALEVIQAATLVYGLPTRHERNMEAVKDLFDRFDTNAGGSIDRTEMSQGLAEYGFNLSDAEIDHLMEKFDTNNDLENMQLSEMKVLAECYPSVFDSDNLSCPIPKRKIDRIEVLRGVAKRQERKVTRWECIWFVIFLMVQIILGITQLNQQDTYDLEAAMKYYLAGDPMDQDTIAFEEIENFDELWSWLQDGLVEAVFPPEVWYNGESFQESEKEYILNYNKLVGGFRMVQQRVKVNKGCIASEKFPDFASDCWDELNPTTEDKESFGTTYNPVLYQWDEQALGYKVDFPLDRTLAFKKLKELKSTKFITKQTRMLTINFGVYNSQKRLFCFSVLEIDFLPTGIINPDLKMSTFTLEPYLNRAPYLEIIVAIYIGVCVILMFRRLILGFYDAERAALALQGKSYPLASGKQNKPTKWRFWPEGHAGYAFLLKYMFSFWFIVECVRLSLMIMAGYKWVSMLNNKNADDVISQLNDLADPNVRLPTGKVQYFDITVYDELRDMYIFYYGMVIFVNLISMLKFFYVDEKMGLMVRCIVAASKQIASWSVVFFLTIICFAVMGLIMFGNELNKLQTLDDSLFEMIKMLFAEGYELNDFDYSTIPLKKLSSRIFYISFIVVEVILMLNIILAILMDAYAEINSPENVESIECVAEKHLTISFLKEMWLDAATTVLNYIPLASAQRQCKLMRASYVPSGVIHRHLTSPALEGLVEIEHSEPILKHGRLILQEKHMLQWDVSLSVFGFSAALYLHTCFGIDTEKESAKKEKAQAGAHGKAPAPKPHHMRLRMH